MFACKGCREELFMYKRKRNQPYYTNRHSCFLLQYPIVLVTKYRKPVFWSQSYFVTTVGNNTIERVQAYIQDQQEPEEKS